MEYNKLFLYGFLVLCVILMLTPESRTKNRTNNGNTRRRKKNENRLQAIIESCKNSRSLIIEDVRTGKPVKVYTTHTSPKAIKRRPEQFRDFIREIECMGDIEKVICHSPQHMYVKYYNGTKYRIFKHWY